MAITNGYATLEEARAFVDYTAGYTSDDGEIETAVEAASRMIDEYTGDIFYTDDAATRYFTPTRADQLRITPSLRSVTTLKTGRGDNTFTVTWTADVDYYLMPFNPVNGQPYQRISTPINGARRFDPTIPRSVEIVGDWGWAAVPTAIKEACLLEANRLHFRRTSPSGTAGSIDIGQIPLRAGMDPDARKLLRPYRRLAPVIA